MDKKKAFNSSTQWISDEQKIHESADYGRNKTAVEEALTEQQRRVKLVNEFSKDVSKAKAASKSSSESSHVESAYGELREVASHRLGCLQDIAQIASLEDVFNMMSIEFAQRATTLVVDACSEASASSSSAQDEAAGGEDGSDGIARAAQSCILAVRNNWNWISKLVKCADTHLKHVSEYHQFFHEGKEYDKWMPSELNKQIRVLEAIKPDENDGHKLLIMLKETLAIFLHWQNKINTLFEKSRKIVPVHFRTKTLDHYRPVMSLCEYKTNEINIQEGEELTLIDNSKPQVWLVRNMHATESHVPSVICVIPGPDTDAVSMATRLRIQLLKTWTVCLKGVGRVIIMFFKLIFSKQDENTLRKLRCLSDDDKMRSLQAIQWIIDIFSKYWGQDPEYATLSGHLVNTRQTLRERGDSQDYDSSFSREYITNMKSIEELLTHFKNYLSQWETYKLLSEASRHTDQMLLVENWETLKYFQTQDVLRKVTLGFDEGEGSFGSGSYTNAVSNGDEGSYGSGGQEVITKSSTTTLQSGMDGSGGQEVITKSSTTTLQSGMDGSGGQEVITKSTTTTLQSGRDAMDYTEEETITDTVVEETIETTNGSSVVTEMTEEYQSESTSAETEQLMHAEQEERKRFIITGVLDPSTDKVISMDKAVMLGIINQDKGTYYNRVTRESIPMPVAMSSGKIKVESVAVKKSAEKRSDVGLITVRTQRESRPYAVKAVVDARTEEQLSVDEAIQKEILNQHNGTVINTLIQKSMSLSDAIDSGLLIVEFDEDYPETESENITITYSIHGVVDQRQQNKVSFSQAVRRGLIDKATGSYFHNKDMENINVVEAIKRGFIKATVVNDPSSLDIAPENKMFVEKVDLIRKKLVNPLKTISAMRSAVEEHREYEVTSGGGAQARPEKNGITVDTTARQSTTDVHNLSPRQPGDGRDSSDFNIKNKQHSGITAEKNSEAYLDQTLVKQMTSTHKESRLSEITKLFQPNLSHNGGTKPKVSSNVSKLPQPKGSVSPRSPSRIPIFQQSFVQRLPSKQSRMQRAVSLNILPSNYSRLEKNEPLMTSSTQDLSLKSDSDFDSGVGMYSMQSISESNLTSHLTRRRYGSSSENVLIYTQETVSHLPLPVKPVTVPTVQMCTVGTQYESKTEESAATKTNEMSTFITEMNSNKQSSQNKSGKNVTNVSIENTTCISDKTTVMVTSVSKSYNESKTVTSSEHGEPKMNIEVSGITAEAAISNLNQSIENNNENKDIVIVSSKSSTDMVDGISPGASAIPRLNSPQKVSKKSRKQQAKMAAKKESSSLSQSSAIIVKKQESDSDEDYYLASESGLSTATGLRLRGTASASSVPMLTETHSQHTEELMLLQEAIATLSAKPDIDEDDSDGSALCLKICKACLPLQMLMLMLLGLACLLPMSEEEYSCALANNLEGSMDVMLKHRDGPPPF